MEGWDQNCYWLGVGMECIRFSQDRGRWPALVNTVMNHWFLALHSSLVLLELFLDKLNNSFIFPYVDASRHGFTEVGTGVS
jgi:hypothetical protein